MRILRLVERLAGVPEPTERHLTEILDRRRADDLLQRVDTRIGFRGGIVVLELNPAIDLEGSAVALARLGPPLDMDIVSPPIRDPGRPDRGPDWDRKHSVCHLIGERRVWFGLETKGDVAKLVSIAIHYDD